MDTSDRTTADAGAHGAHGGHGAEGEHGALGGHGAEHGPGSGHAPGYTGNREDILRRLRRIEGQVRGLHRMVEQDTYCIDVLTQVSATTRALESVALLLLDDHLSHCVADAIAEGGQSADEKVREASAAIARLVRS